MDRELIKLSPKAFELLAFLAAHREGASGRQIIEALWPGETTHLANQYLQATVDEVRHELSRAMLQYEQKHGCPAGIYITLLSKNPRVEVVPRAELAH